MRAILLSCIGRILNRKMAEPVRLAKEMYVEKERKKKTEEEVIGVHGE